jgi:hypothetical protein
MAVMLTALRTGRALLRKYIIACLLYSFMLEAEYTLGTTAAGRITQNDKFQLSHRFSNPQPSACSVHYATARPTTSSVTD